jgi:hypothetical protein
VLARLDLVAMNSRVLDVAASLPPSVTRTLDAIHLAAALVTYDDRLARAAVAAGITVVTPR